MKRWTLVLVAAGAITLTGFTAAARIVSPLGGRAWVPSEAGCFGNSHTRLTNNNCDGFRKWLFDAPLDHNPNGSDDILIVFVGRGDGVTPVKCWGISNTPDGSQGWQRRWERTSVVWGELTPITGDRVFVPSGNSLHADCDLPRNGGVSQMWYIVSQ